MRAVGGAVQPSLPELTPIHVPSHRPPDRRPRRWVALAVVAALVTAAPLDVGAQSREDVERARREQAEVREDAAAVAARIDALGDEADELVTELELLDITIAAAESRLEVASRVAEATAMEVDALDQRIARLEAARSELRRLAVESAVEQYVAGHEAQGTMLSAPDPVSWSLRQGLYSLVVSDVASLGDRLRAVDDELQGARAEARALAAAAAEERDRVDELASAARRAKETQAEVLTEVQHRLDARLAEAESLATIDAQLSEEIRRGEEAIARRLALAGTLGNTGGDQDGGRSPIARPGDIVNVRGIDIHRSIAEQLRAMINAAEADGIHLGGSGWRSTERQIELRRQNCGTSDYLIFEAPAEACYPPTARPASSLHEAGLAVDFTVGGRAIVDRGSAAFQWLAANAPGYGFHNLWSEPWHWSVDGR